MQLINVFKTEEKIYEVSKKKEKFKYYLIKNNISLSNEILERLLSNKIKIYSYRLFQKLKSKNINIISINDKNYPKKLLNMYLPMFCIYYKGNIENINKKNIYLYYENTKSSYYNKIYNDFAKYIESFEKINILKGGNNKLFKKAGLLVKYTNVEKELLKKSKKSDEYILIDKRIYEKEYYIELLSALCDVCIIPKAKYQKFITYFCDSLLEKSKEMLVCPGGIYSKSTYFSNYLIKEGAYVLTNKYDIKNYI